ncbi:helix-turn-helix transcriptional regulator [Changpingibacter yushuensis]|uniref:helix-turn-helix transcriptional regulator n=1 Tax=Changpingibacter yushuensis TaxID=2758440 RepID=UPI0015F669E6|nr:WYL domain-containing protein [Changpingibacter yushuensis]
MIAVYDVVATQAILVYLDRMPSRTSTLGEIGNHFNMKWSKVLTLLWEANTVDFPGEAPNFDLSLPLPDSALEEGEEPASPDSVVSLGDMSGMGMPQLDLTLDEALVIVALLDSLLEVTPPGPAQDALLEVRGKLRQSAEAAGFGAAVWGEPSLPIDGESLAQIVAAIETKHHVVFSYYRPGPSLHAEVTEVDLVPFSILSGLNPALRGSKSGEIRRYRLDRIADARIGKKASREEIRIAREGVSAEDSTSRESLNSGGSAWQPSGQHVTLTVTRAGRWAAETLPGTVATELEGKLVISMPVTSEDWLAGLVVQLGDAVVGIEPQDVAERMSARFGQLLKENR